MSPSIPFDQVHALWLGDASRLKDTEPGLRRVMDHIIDRLLVELRRRSGSRFTADELAEIYLEGTEWTFEVARATAPYSPEAWDMPTLIGAAFAKHVNGAQDFGGGRRRGGEDEPGAD